MYIIFLGTRHAIKTTRAEILVSNYAPVQFSYFDF